MQVLKFGGTSVANARSIQKVIQILQKAIQKDKTIAVFSAMGGITDALLHSARLAANGNEAYRELLSNAEERHFVAVQQLLPVTVQASMLGYVKKQFIAVEDLCRGVYLLGEVSDRTTDKILSFGELLSSQIIAAALKCAGVDNVWLNSQQIVRTNSQFTAATVEIDVTYNNIEAQLAQHHATLYVVPGFIASNASGAATTLGRGGSDYTAAIFAAATNAAVLEIWTDVSGMMTADPRLVPHAKTLPEISYQEAMELSHFGAKVIYPPTLQPVLPAGIPITIKNTFASGDSGTLIKSVALANNNRISGISCIHQIALLTLEGSGMVGVPGFSKKFFEALASAGISTILITQGSSEHSICAGVERSRAQHAKDVLDTIFNEAIQAGRVQPIIMEDSLAIVALVGDRMKSHAGVSGRMFGALGRNGINVRAIAQGASERNISAVIAGADVKKAVNVLHEEFFESTCKQINLFIVGTGNVGGRLLAQLQQQASFLLQQLNVQIRLVGIANSKKMLLNAAGICLHTWKEALENGLPMCRKDFFAFLLSKNLRNTVFADVTASTELPLQYELLLRKSVSVVACNKIACSGHIEQYSTLKKLALEYNANFLFETNVGAGLPVISTLNDLVRSGDKITGIEAVLSGTLNFVFNEYNGTKSFAKIVKNAQEQGYTEPDPRIDLSGTDVKRKILILAREAGAALEMEHISSQSFLPEECLSGDVDNFYHQLQQFESCFLNLYQQAAANNCRLRFVASYRNGKASMGLQSIAPQHHFYHLYGKDNALLFYTHRYNEQPLVIKGAGAGAAVTASGVFADIMRAARV